MAIAEHVSTVIRSLTRVLLRYSGIILIQIELENNFIIYLFIMLLDKLNKPKKNRREHATLADFVEWVFASVGRHEIICRTECMELFSALAPLLPGTYFVIIIIILTVVNPFLKE